MSDQDSVFHIITVLRERVEEEVREIIELRDCCDKRAIRIEELERERDRGIQALVHADRERFKLRTRCASMGDAFQEMREAIDTFGTFAAIERIKTILGRSALAGAEEPKQKAVNSDNP